MNKDHVLFHLEEAEKAIGDAISNIKAESDYEAVDLRIDMSHVYHHLNTAWNGREASEEDSRENSDENFDKWRSFPKDLDDWLA